MASTRLHFYLEHRDALIDQATRIVGDQARAEDVVQDAWLRFSASSGHDADDNPIGKPAAYLRRIVRNLAIDFARRQSLENVHPDGDADLYDMPAAEPSPERAAIARDELEHVTATLEALPERTRLAFDLYRFHGKTLVEIGVILGVSQTRAHQLVQEAMMRCTAGLLGDD